jgi:hypothetical protein
MVELKHFEPFDEKKLGFDKNGSYIGLDPNNPESMHDCMGVVYKYCRCCGKYYTLDAFSLKKNGEHSEWCNNCKIKHKKANERWKANKEAREAAKPASLHKVGRPAKLDLTMISDIELVNEMKRRGWTGSVTVKTVYEL